MGRLRALLRDERGNVTVISAFMILPMLLLAGGATDIARYEAFRAQLQDGVDRAVLAAASLSQSRSAKDTVDEYMKSVSFIDAVDVSVDIKDALNARMVTVSADYRMTTAFLPLIGIDELDIRAVASAEERRSNIEMSLMLDFSGSMVGAKYKALKVAATQFVQTMVTPETRDYTTINMVPYAGQVSIGSFYFDYWQAKRDHHNSSCVELAKPDYGTGPIDIAGRKQVPHFTNWNATNYATDLNPSWCPTEQTSIVLMSNDADDMTKRIAGYKMHDGTGSAIAMNWGLAMLDPGMRPWIEAGVEEGLIDPAFAERPASFDDEDTLKVIVLMTDGEITEQVTAIDPNAGVRAPKNAKELVDSFTKLGQNRSRTAALFRQVCDAAQDHNILIFTIGFQLKDSNDAQRQMKQDLLNCASNPSQYFDVQGLDIASAFKSIAGTIQRIKLTR